MAMGAQGGRVWFTTPAAPIPHYVMSKGTRPFNLILPDVNETATGKQAVACPTLPVLKCGSEKCLQLSLTVAGTERPLGITPGVACVLVPGRGHRVAPREAAGLWTLLMKLAMPK